MWSKLDPIWQTALELAWEAYRAGSIPVGAVIAGPDGEVVTCGRNRTAETASPHRQVCDSNLAHAEINALLLLPRHVPQRHLYTLYTTLEPCPLCLGALYMSGIRRFAFACRDPYAGSTNLLGTTPYLARKAVTYQAPQNAILENVLMAIQTEDMIRMMGEDEQRRRMVLDPWRAALPAAVALGERLYTSGRLLERKHSCPSIAPVVDELALEFLSASMDTCFSTL